MYFNRHPEQPHYRFPSPLQRVLVKLLYIYITASRNSGERLGRQPGYFADEKTLAELDPELLSTQYDPSTREYG